MDRCGESSKQSCVKNICRDVVSHRYLFKRCHQNHNFSLSNQSIQFSIIFFSVLWSLISSIFVHTCAALIAFVTLRKHKFGRFFSILILVIGVVSPATSGIVSSAAIAFVHRVSSLQMLPVYALVWGIGQTIVSAFVGYLRILATLWNATELTPNTHTPSITSHPNDVKCETSLT